MPEVRIAEHRNTSGPQVKLGRLRHACRGPGKLNRNRREENNEKMRKTEIRSAVGNRVFDHHAGRTGFRPGGAGRGERAGRGEEKRREDRTRRRRGRREATLRILTTTHTGFGKNRCFFKGRAIWPGGLFGSHVCPETEIPGPN